MTASFPGHYRAVKEVAPVVENLISKPPILYVDGNVDCIDNSSVNPQ